MNTKSAIEIYGLVGKACQRFERAPPSQEAVEILGPIVYQMGGVVASARGTTIGIGVDGKSARIFFHHAKEPIGVCAVSLKEDGQSLWAWVTEWGPGEKAQHATPDAPIWAAVALRADFVDICGEDACGLTEVIPALVHVLVAKMVEQRATPNN